MELNKSCHCYYCGLADEKVEASGIYYCPNPYCQGPGACYFRSRLPSCKDHGSTHSVDPEEYRKESVVYLRNYPDLAIKIRKMCKDYCNPYKRVSHPKLKEQVTS